MKSSVVSACAALLVGAQSGGDGALQAFNAYAPMHIGVEVTGFGGVYRIDAKNVVASQRLTAQSNGELSAVWLFYRTVGAPGPFEVSVYATKGADPTLRELSNMLYCTRVTPRAAADSAAWERVPLAASGEPRIARGDVLHVVLEPAVGSSFDADNRVELVTTRARSTMAWLPASRQGDRLASIADDAFAFLYAREARSPLDALVQLTNNAEYLPILVVEEKSGALSGQPCDLHCEERIFGSHGFGEIVRLPGPITIDYVAMYSRGAGEANAGRPSDDLYVDIVERDTKSGASRALVSKLVIAQSSGRLFKGRSHWFGRFLERPMTLEGGPAKEYALILSSPGSKGPESDAWIYTADGSTLLAAGRTPSFGMEESRACRAQMPIDDGDGAGGARVASFGDFKPATDAPFRLGLYAARGPSSVALLDEVQVNRIGQDGLAQPGFPLSFAPGDCVQFAVQARNIGLDTVSGGPVFARFVDRVTGRTVAGPVLFPTILWNDERGAELSFQMPSIDLMLSLEVGHIDVVGKSGLSIVEDVTSWEIRVR